jgi:chromate reductase
MRVLGISGSLRRDSHNTKLLRAAGEIVERHGGEFEVFDGLKAIPPYNEDDDVGEGPPAVDRLRQAIAGADAVLFATPEYNSSIPGVLKNAVDWVSRPLATNPCATRWRCSSASARTSKWPPDARPRPQARVRVLPDT